MPDVVPPLTSYLPGCRGGVSFAHSPTALRARWWVLLALGIATWCGLWRHCGVSRGGPCLLTTVERRHQVFEMGGTSRSHEECSRWVEMPLTPRHEPPGGGGRHPPPPQIDKEGQARSPYKVLGGGGCPAKEFFPMAPFVPHIIPGPGFSFFLRGAHTNGLWAPGPITCGVHKPVYGH